MSLLTGGDYAVAIQGDYTCQFEGSVRVNSLRLEDIGTFQTTAKAGDRERSNQILAMVGGGEGLNGDGLTVSRNGHRWGICRGLATVGMQRAERAASRIFRA